MWRYAIERGDDDPARAAFVSEAQARLRAEATAERRRQAARKATEALRAKLRAAGIDPHTYYSRLAQRGNAARWGKQSAAAAAAEAAPAPQDAEHGAQAGPPAIEAAPGPSAIEAAPPEVVAEAGEAEGQSVTGAQVPQAIATGVHRPGELPAHLL